MKEKKLAEEMEKRRARIKQWQTERKIQQALEEEKRNQEAELEQKKWSLEDEEEDDAEDEPMPDPEPEPKPEPKPEPQPDSLSERPSSSTGNGAPPEATSTPFGPSVLCSLFFN